MEREREAWRGKRENEESCKAINKKHTQRGEACKEESRDKRKERDKQGRESGRERSESDKLRCKEERRTGKRMH